MKKRKLTDEINLVNNTDIQNKKPANWSQFMIDISNGKFDNLLNLFTQGSRIINKDLKYAGKAFDIDSKNEYDESAFLWACRNDNLLLAKLLLNQGSKAINDKSTLDDYEYIYNSPLIHAYENKNLEMAKWLIELGADLTIEGRDGRPLFSFVCSNTNLDHIKWFVEKYLEKYELEEEVFHYRASDSKGFQSLNYAAKFDNTEVVEYLYNKIYHRNKITPQESYFRTACENGANKNVNFFLHVNP